MKVQTTLLGIVLIFLSEARDIKIARNDDSSESENTKNGTSTSADDTQTVTPLIVVKSNQTSAVDEASISSPKPLPHLCTPSPCGVNAQCKNGICTCLGEYSGDPYVACRECILNTDCPINKACIKDKCLEPCPGACGLNALCMNINHAPVCSCPAGLTGDPYYICLPPDVLECQEKRMR